MPIFRDYTIICIIVKHSVTLDINNVLNLIEHMFYGIIKVYAPPKVLVLFHSDKVKYCLLTYRGEKRNGFFGK